MRLWAAGARLARQADRERADKVPPRLAVNAIRIPSTESPHAQREKSPFGLADKTRIDSMYRKYGKDGAGAPPRFRHPENVGGPNCPAGQPESLQRRQPGDDSQASNVPLSEALDLLLQHLLHPMFGDEDVGDLHMELLGGLGGLPVFDRHEPEGMPGQRFDTLLDSAHGEFEQLVMEGVFHLLFKVGECISRIGDFFNLNRCEVAKSFQAFWVTTLSQARKLRPGSYSNVFMAVSSLSKTSCATSSASEGCDPHFRHQARMVG
jgi:hypothetical protein